jgi:hypothetical protein
VVTHFIPWEFPLLLLVPAVVTDLILQRTHGWRVVLRAVAAGLVFFVVFFAVQWLFANFLMSPLARNWFFGTTYQDYDTPPTSLYARFLFVPADPAPQFWWGLAIAALTTCVMTYVGLHAGRAMQRVRR